MSDVYTVTDKSETKKSRKLNLKKAGKYAALTIFGGAVALVVLDKASNRKTSKVTHTVTETDETTES